MIIYNDGTKNMRKFSRSGAVSRSVFGKATESIEQIKNHENCKDKLNPNTILNNRVQQYFNIGGKKRSLPRR